MSLENRGILLQGTIRKINSQEGGFFNFLRPLMTAGLPLMKGVLTPLTKSVTIRIISRNVSSRYSYSKENLWIRKYSINNFKWRNRRYGENS